MDCAWSYPLVHSRVDINRLKDTSYEVIISVLISDDDITTQSTLDCELKIPDTPYVKRKTFVFFQGNVDRIQRNSVFHYILARLP
ncbi:Ig-like domain-containing protein [Aphis craccivora]|uniref:Ig-like domain-containing protein n=1 Tax=Aphis craccivora TaxID=307492 RepID=A0A6G0ZPL8_APHCR|nr:Ig-like domain-containing protein [Aphis craccivora]